MIFGKTEPFFTEILDSLLTALSDFVSAEAVGNRISKHVVMLLLDIDL